MVILINICLLTVVNVISWHIAWEVIFFQTSHRTTASNVDVETVGVRRVLAQGHSCSSRFVSNPLVPRVQKINICQLALTDFYRINLYRK